MSFTCICDGKLFVIKYVGGFQFNTFLSRGSLQNTKAHFYQHITTVNTCLTNICMYLLGLCSYYLTDVELSEVTVSATYTQSLLNDLCKSIII